MQADLTGVQRRTVRAKRDFDALRDKVAAYMDSPPYRAVVERDGNNEAVRTYIDRDPDPEWGIDFGCVGVQARTALDHLVYQLVIDSGNPVSERTRTQFPIYESKSSYLSGGKGSPRERMLAGVASRHRRIIDQLQPYQRKGRALDDPLSILTAISNRDKHREDHVAWGGVGQATYRLERSHLGIEDVPITFNYPPDAPERITQGGFLFGIENSPAPDAPDQKIKVELDGLRTVLLFEGDRVVSLDDLERVVLHVIGIVERFANRIKP